MRTPKDRDVRRHRIASRRPAGRAASRSPASRSGRDDYDRQAPEAARAARRNVFGGAGDGASSAPRRGAHAARTRRADMDHRDQDRLAARLQVRLITERVPSRWSCCDMAMKILAECINCGACEPECPNQAISAADGIYLIDAERCTECVGAYESPRCVEVCPVDCIPHDPDRVESPEVLQARYASLHA